MHSWRCPYCWEPIGERDPCCGEVGHAEPEPEICEEGEEVSE